MDYIPPLNTTPTEADPQPAYFDGNAQTGQQGSYPSGKAIENPMREILNVITGVGLTPSGADLTQLYQAIQAAIAAALADFDPDEGGGSSPDFSLMPVFPHVTSGAGVMSVTAGTGSVAVAAGQTFVHRGGTAYNSTDTEEGDRTFTTAASKTYHLRWRYNAGSPAFGLYDLADGGYNPTSADETNAAFDSTYDDMLIARVATDGSNVPTVTALKNLHHLAFNAILDGAEATMAAANGANFRFTQTLNWARSPDRVAFTVVKALNGTKITDTDFNVFSPDAPHGTPEQAGGQAPINPLTRYGLDARVLRDFAAELHMNLSCGA